MERRLPAAAALVLVLAAGCADSARLEEGEWTGALTPMNHPDMQNPVRYDVRYEGRTPVIRLVGPGGDTVSTRDVRVEDDTLFFTFDEPEEAIPLTCALARLGDEAGYAGRCTDPDGQWAQFTMHPPG